MTSNQHTGIERVSEERLTLEEIVERVALKLCYQENEVWEEAPASYRTRWRREAAQMIADPVRVQKLSLRASAGQEPGFPDFYAVQSKSGAHIGLWSELDTAHKVASDPDYAGSTIIPLYTHPAPSVGAVTEGYASGLSKAFGLLGVDCAFAHDQIKYGNAPLGEAMLAWFTRSRQAILREKLRAENPGMGAEDLTDLVRAAIPDCPFPAALSKGGPRNGK